MEQTDYIRENIAEASSYILSKSDQHPQVAVILGSGMSSALPQLESQVVLPYKDIPHFPLSLVAGHQGELVCGKLAGKSIIALLGRFHFYEGYTILPKEHDFFSYMIFSYHRNLGMFQKS